MKLTAFLLTLLFTNLVLAAIGATLSGRVTDANGAVLVGATVEVVNTATNAKANVVTNNQGLFVVPELPAGVYRITIKQNGFQTLMREGLILNVGDRINERFVLSAGQIEETVSVEGRASLIEKDSAAVATVVDQQFVKNLPLNGRSFQTLIELTPGVVLTKTGSTGGTIATGQFSVNGQRTNANYFMVDGVGANVGASVTAQGFQQAAGTLPGFTVTGGTNGLTSVDALQEFRVQTSTYSAEFGRSPGAQISIVTRSGTNQYTGTLYNYFRNEKLDANDWFDNRDGRARRKLRQNNFGGVLGGPIRFPPSIFGPLGFDGKDKSFFFFSYEGLRLVQPQPGVIIARVPTPEFRNAATGTFRDVLNAFPLPNAPAQAGDPTGTGRYIAGLSYPTRQDAWSLRFDQRLSSKMNLFARYNDAPSNMRVRSFPSQENAFASNLRTFTTGWTWTISPRIVSDFRFNYSRSRGLFEFSGVAADGAIIPNLDNYLPSFASGATSRLSLQVIPGVFNAGLSASNLTLGKAVGNQQRQFNYVENFTIIAGKHEVKFGFDYRRLRPIQDASDIGISYAFNPNLSGALSSITIQAFQPVTDFLVHNFSGFAQDTWRVTRRATLTLGARYEVNPPAAGKRLPYTLVGLENPLTARLAPAGTRQWETTWDNIAPRVGLALTLSEKLDLVVRGGFGIFYDTAQGTALRGYSSFPYNTTRTITTPSLLRFPANPADVTPPPFSDTLAPPYTSSFFVFDRNLELPYTRQWNLTLEKGLGRQQKVSASYVGAQGRRLLRAEQLRNYNAAFVQQRFGLTTGAITVLPLDLFGPAPSTTPQAGAPVSITRNGTTSDYHALQLQFQRRLTRGFQALASYSWSKSLDDISDEFTAGIPPSEQVLRLERGHSDFDIRHVFTTALTYEIQPLSGNAFVRSVLGNWGIDAIGRWRSASPFHVITQNFDILNIAATRRVDILPGVPVWLDDAAAPGGRRVNPAAFAVPAPSKQGTLARNSLRAFSARQVDLSLRRQFNLNEKLRMQFRAEAFNVTNTPNFNDPAASYINSTLAPCAPNTTNFGCSVSMLGRGLSGNTGASQTSPSAGFNSLFQVGGPRSLQLSLKLLF